MSVFVKKYTPKSGGTVIQLVYKRGRTVERIEHIGTAHTDDDLNTLIELANSIKYAGQTELDLDFGTPHALGMTLEKTYSKLLFKTLERVYERLGFDELGDTVFKQLVLARIIEPASKLDTIRILDDLGLDAPSNTTIHRTLKRIASNDYRSSLSVSCLKNTTADSLSLVLYDVTTLYFEAQAEDDFKKSGLSKERRLDPQIIVGLLIDRNGLPLEIASFEGNKAEVHTLIPVLDTFIRRHGLTSITVVADAAMLSGANLTRLEEMGFGYIVASRLAKTPYEIEEYRKDKDEELYDMQIFDTFKTFSIASKHQKRRVVYQYREKRARLDLINIEKALVKAQKMVDGQSDVKRNRFVKITGSTKEINYELAEESRLKAGIKGYVTNLDIDPNEVINAYHELFKIERAFRMSKSDLKARPIYHHKKESIDAHLTVVFAALAVIHVVQTTTGMTIKRFINMLKPLRSGKVRIGRRIKEIEPAIPKKAQLIIDQLNSW